MERLVSVNWCIGYIEYANLQESYCLNQLMYLQKNMFVHFCIYLCLYREQVYVRACVHVFVLRFYIEEGINLSINLIKSEVTHLSIFIFYHTLVFELPMKENLKSPLQSIDKLCLLSVIENKFRS